MAAAFRHNRIKNGRSIVIKQCFCHYFVLNKWIAVENHGFSLIGKSNNPNTL